MVSTASHPRLKARRKRSLHSIMTCLLKNSVILPHQSKKKLTHLEAVNSQANKRLQVFKSPCRRLAKPPSKQMGLMCLRCLRTCMTRKMLSSRFVLTIVQEKKWRLGQISQLACLNGCARLCSALLKSMKVSRARPLRSGSNASTTMTSTLKLSVLSQVARLARTN